MNKFTYGLAIVVGLILGWLLLSMPRTDSNQNVLNHPTIQKTVIDSLFFEEHWIKIVELKRSWDAKKVQEINIYEQERLTNRVLLEQGQYLGMVKTNENAAQDIARLCIWTTKEEIILTPTLPNNEAYEDVQQLQSLHVVQQPYNKVDINYSDSQTYLSSFFEMTTNKQEEVYVALVWMFQESGVEVLGQVKAYSSQMYYYPKDTKEEIEIPKITGDSQQGSIRVFWEERYNK